MTLSPEEELRYNRQIILKQIDFDGQEALKKSKVLVLGLGGLGCAASQYLTAAGVGHLTLVDDDSVELANLQRQILHQESSLGELKVDSAAETLSQINSMTHFTCIAERLDDTALANCIAQHDIVLDCSDNVETRNQLNRLCFRYKKTLVSGAAIRLEGQICVFTYQDDEACYACLSHLFGEQTLSCVEAGILSPVVGIIGAMQALEAIKRLTQFEPNHVNRLMLFDASDAQWRNFKLTKNPNCPVCQTI